MSNSRKDSYAWLVEKIKSDNFQTSFFGYRYGTDCQPTGTGKASEQIIDCAFKIKFGGDRQMVFNFASHRLALSYQLAGNLIYCLKEAGYITPENACIVINSSDSADKYNNDPDMGKFLSIGLNELINTRKQYIFVVSCYKSHPKIEEYLTDNLKDAYKVSYWDEAHLVSVTNTEVESNVNVAKSLKVFDNVFAFSATPKDEVTMALETREAEVNPNFHVGVRFRNYVKHITIKEAITNKTILPVSFNTITSSNLESIEDKGKLCLKVLENLKERTNKLNHKILISLDRKEDVKEILEYFKSKGKTAFATTSKYGFESTEESLNYKFYISGNIFTYVYEKIDTYGSDTTQGMATGTEKTVKKLQLNLNPGNYKYEYFESTESNVSFLQACSFEGNSFAAGDTYKVSSTSHTVTKGKEKKMNLRATNTSKYKNTTKNSSSLF